MSDCCRMKIREDEEKRNLENRLSRIEGQIRGIKKMVVSDAYCVDILTQVAAAQSALNSFNKLVLSSHIKTCVADSVKNGEHDKIDELVETIQKLMK